MSDPSTAVTVRAGGWRRTFTPGRDLVIGRDIHADVRISHPAVSRSHVVLRHLDNGHWVAFDNDSSNGIYHGYERTPFVDIDSGVTIHLGDPEGPPLTFELGNAPPAEIPSTARMRRRAAAAGPGSTTIGRAPGNDIVITDMLASKHHATVVATPAGTRIRQTGGINTTFVNGQRVRDAALHESDVVTIGNADFLYAGGHLVRQNEPASTIGGVEVRDINLTIDGSLTLLDRVSFEALPGTLTAVIGPSGSGKSTLMKVLVGALRPTTGTVTFDGRDLHAEYASLRSRIGIVPQDDIVHRRLTVEQALRFAAELRMPPDTTEQDREHVITQVLDELEMTAHARTRVHVLSGGQRKRVSIAMELLTNPQFLVLDEPTSGLDPALDQQVMRMLRRLADAGRVIVVVTHSLNFLDGCDQLVLLAPGGRMAFRGPLSDVSEAMGATDWADIYTEIGSDPAAAQERFFARADRRAAQPAVTANHKAVRSRRLAHTNPRRQLSAVARRQVQVIVANRGYLLFLTGLPFLVGLLPLAVGGDTGLSTPLPDGSAPFGPKQILGLMNLDAFFMGTALTVRELVSERAIFRHEQAVGLSTSAYLGAKIMVFGGIAVLQSAVLVAIVTMVKGAPREATVLGSPTLELFVGVAATCVASAIVGLFVSTLAKTGNQVLPLTVMTLMVQIVLAGGLIAVTGRPIDPLSWFTPARWGLAATASTTDLTVLAKDSHWKHTAAVWLFDILMLVVVSALFAGLTRWRLRLRSVR